MSTRETQPAVVSDLRLERYRLGELPPDERAMVLAFDDSLVLLGGPTGDREALQAAAEGGESRGHFYGQILQDQ